MFNNVTCPIVASSAAYYNEYTADGHNVSVYKNKLTYETTITFDGDGGKVNGESRQNKLYNQSVKHEKDSQTNIWAINTNYALPIAKKDNCKFLQWNDSTGAKLNLATATAGDNTTFTAVYEALILISINAEFTQGDNVIYPKTSLDTLKQWLTVTGSNNDGSPRTGAIEYSLSGKLKEDVNTITVTANGTSVTTTFEVTATAKPGMSIGRLVVFIVIPTIVVAVASVLLILRLRKRKNRAE